MAALCVFCTAACADYVSEQGTNADAHIGVNGEIELYPMGGELSVPLYGTGEVFIEKIVENSYDDISWLGFTYNKDHILVYAAENKSSESRRGGLQITIDSSEGTFEKTLPVFQDVPVFEFEKNAITANPLKQTITVNCEANINYFIESNTSGVSVALDGACFTRKDKKFDVEIPAGYQNTERTITLSAMAKDITGNETLQKMEDLLINQEAYVLTFDEEDKDIQDKYLNSTPWEGKTENFVLYSSGQWFLDYEENTPEEHSERWVNVKINGTEMADSVARGGVPKANNLVLEIDPNENESQRHTQIRFISKYDESDNDYYEVTLRVEQEGKPAE